jgi:hypothetical protein
MGGIMAMTDAQLLEQTRLQIDAITASSVQSYSIAGRTVTKLKLIDELWGQVRLLENRIARAAGGGASGVTFASPG